MSLVEQTRDHADSIPSTLPMEGFRIPYRESISDNFSATTQDKPQLDATVVELESIDSNDDDNHSNTSEDTKSITTTASTRSQADDNEMLSVRSLSNSSSTTDLALPAVSGDAPALPAKSNLRASRLLSSIPQKKSVNDDQPILPHAAPHQVYLSSEEDASSSADDFSDFEESDTESSSSQKSTSPRASHEDTARLVSVVFYGKPSIVNLSRRPNSAGSTDSVKGASARGILRTATEPTLYRPRSISASSSTTSTRKHPPRSSSMLTGDEVGKKNRPHFLTIDPSAASKASAESSEGVRTPKTPTGMFRKTLSLVKKRSRSTLVQSESNISRMEQVGEEDEDAAEAAARRQSSIMEQSLSYQDIMKAAKINAAAAASIRSELPRPPPTPSSPKNRFRAGLSLGRQKSVRV